MSQLIDRPITPVIPLFAKPQPPAPASCQWPRDPEAERAQLLRAAVLAAVVQRTQHLDLPPIFSWDLCSCTVHREYLALVPGGQDRGRIAGQIITYGHTPDEIRCGVQAWANALQGQIIESPRSSYMDVCAVVVISGVVVLTSAHLHPDASCPACDGLAVGDVVLRHESHCPLLDTPGGAQ